jgi:N-acetylglucosamine-6-phosphate deacetylase
MSESTGTSPEIRFVNARVVLPDRVLDGGAVHVRGGRVAAVDAADALPRWGGLTVDVGGAYLAPGYIDMHVHGGDGHDFMDVTAEAFEAVVRCHLRHGTTSIVPTNTVGRHDQIMAFLDLARAAHRRGADPAGGLGRVVGSHLYGPYFVEEKIGCHPHLTRLPTEAEYMQYLGHADHLLVATCAPELPGSADFYQAAAAAGVRLNAGHSNATWGEMQVAFDLGVRHVDHFFCAMSNYVSTRSRVGTPMQGGMLEFALASDVMTTELIADGRHLSPDLMRFALRMMGVDRVALVSDASRAVDVPVGDYTFGPLDGGTPFYNDGEVGLTPDRTGLASSTRGLDFMVRHMVQGAKLDVWTAVRMASLTPAKILGLERDIGSIAVGKRADFLVLDDALNVGRIFLDGVEARVRPLAGGPQ